MKWSVFLFVMVVLSTVVSAEGVLVASKSPIVESSGLYLAMGNGLVGQGDLLRATQVYEKGLLLGEDAFILNNLGVISIQQGKVAVAKGFFERSVLANPLYELPRMSLAILYHQEKEYVAAMFELEFLIEKNPSNPSYHYDLAINIADRFREEHVGNLDDAILQFKEADRQSPGFMKSRENIAALENVKKVMGIV
jgi:tetratricopeptide (TPR) repeat protein